MSMSIHSHTAGSPQSYTVGNDELTIRVSAADSAGALAALEVRMPPGGGPPVLHRHDAFELYRVERGELAIYIEDHDGTVRRRLAGPGAVVSIPGGREHTIRNESRHDAHAFVVFAPAGQMESFARAAAALAAQPELGVEDLLALAGAHGIEITRPIEGPA
jgi:mannose-6-phosphate isomerase-like protein (cupin superfamily)